MSNLPFPLHFFPHYTVTLTDWWNRGFVGSFSREIYSFYLFLSLFIYLLSYFPCGSVWDLVIVYVFKTNKQTENKKIPEKDVQITSFLDWHHCFSIALMQFSLWKISYVSLSNWHVWGPLNEESQERKYVNDLRTVSPVLIANEGKNCKWLSGNILLFSLQFIFFFSCVSQMVHT